MSRREFGAETVLSAYNQHWQGIPIFVYQGVFALRGLGSYGLLALAGTLAHLFTVAMLFAVLRGRAHPILALGGALALLLFAWSDEVLLWPVNMVHSLPVGFGLAAILAWDRDRSSWRIDALGALAMTAGLASGGVALAFLLVASAFLISQRPSPQRLLWPTACLVVYLAWYVVFGGGGLRDLAFGVTDPRDGTALDLTALPSFVANGLATLAAPLLGLDYRFRLVSVIALAAAASGAVGWLRYRGLRFWIPLLGILALLP